MKQFRNLWFPDNECELIDAMTAEDNVELAGAGVYQWRKLQATIPHIKDFRHAVDVGANVGTWTRVLARLFTKVTAFEPVKDLQRCFWRNIAEADQPNVRLCSWGLGDEAGTFQFVSDPTTSGWGHIAMKDEPLVTSQIEVRTLDSFADQLPKIDFLKIDCEGYEHKIIMGGREVIHRDRPTILVERKGYTKHRYSEMSSVELLQSWGAELKFEWGGDFCLRWKK